ncbi:MAG: porphobilinogen synthase, partial [Thermoleophilia bacterium]|nr:porphobilinogen synthase [Thermoleophilia bacterium]
MKDVPNQGLLRAVRMRRLRFSPGIRTLVRETVLNPTDLIQPLFVRPGKGIRQPISSLPGQYQWSVDTVV